MAVNRPFWELAQMDQAGVRAAGPPPASMLNPQSPAGALPPEQVAEVMEPAAVAASPEPPPVGSKLRQMWEAYQASPDMRAAALAAGAMLLQPTPPGQSHAGMLGQALMAGAQTLEQRRAMASKEALAQEELGIRRESVDVQRKGVEEQAKQRGEDRISREEQKEADRLARSHETERDRTWRTAESASRAQIEKTLQEMRGDQALALEKARQEKGVYQSTHPTVHLVETEGAAMYKANKAHYDKIAAERGMEKGLDVAVAETFQAHREVKRDPNRARVLEYKSRLKMLENWWDRDTVTLFGAATPEEQAALREAQRELFMEGTEIDRTPGPGERLPPVEEEPPAPPTGKLPPDPMKDKGLTYILTDPQTRSKYISPEVKEIEGVSYQQVYKHLLPSDMPSYVEGRTPPGHTLAVTSTGELAFIPFEMWREAPSRQGR